ncbi:hypothetical protein M0R72_11940 [Candidatus Pacearchaeota archaeon]|jgi:hypothetical protein|nr:hypothetical protein [Candidatus Pacearchaeota archaeon]
MKEKTKYQEALMIVETEAEMMRKGNRAVSTSIRWLKEAIESLEASVTEGEKE